MAEIPEQASGFFKGGHVRKMFKHCKVFQQKRKLCIENITSRPAHVKNGRKQSGVDEAVAYSASLDQAEDSEEISII